MSDYKPHAKSLAIARKGLEHIKSVPYLVSIRWLFYRLLQDGYYQMKEDYSKYIALMTKLRYAFFEGYHPAILTDESRHAFPREEAGEESVDDYKALDIPELMLDRMEFLDIQYPLDHFYRQDYYVEICYEARAMTAQFQYYTKDIMLIPCGGQISLPYGWEMAKRLEEMSEKYDKPVVVLFFGDCDTYGERIADAVGDKLSQWCNADFELKWCGLTEEQATLHNVPENPEKPGFQWEALEDGAAGSIITDAVDEYISKEIIDEVQSEQEEHEREANERVEEIVEEIREPVRELIEEALKK